MYVIMVAMVIVILTTFLQSYSAASESMGGKKNLLMDIHDTIL